MLLTHKMLSVEETLALGTPSAEWDEVIHDNTTFFAVIPLTPHRPSKPARLV